ncbi:MAG: helix-turn-helix transcriptional regulator, partial [Acidobacteriota bacterium]
DLYANLLGSSNLDFFLIEHRYYLHHSAFMEERGRVKPIQVDLNSSDPIINVAELGHYIRRKRETDRLSLRAVAKQTQVSASTLSRIENGTGTPDAQTLARLAKWLNLPFERVIGLQSPAETPIVYFPQESLPDIVEAHLRADRKLNPETARALSDLFRVAYTQFSSNGLTHKNNG